MKYTKTVDKHTFSVLYDLLSEIGLGIISIKDIGDIDNDIYELVVTHRSESDKKTFERILEVEWDKDDQYAPFMRYMDFERVEKYAKRRFADVVKEMAADPDYCDDCGEDYSAGNQEGCYVDHQHMDKVNQGEIDVAGNPREKPVPGTDSAETS